MADDDKKRTQEGSETNFTTRGGRQDETSGAGKPWTSPCKRRPETPVDDAATVADSPPTLSNALHTIPALADACSARDLLILSCVSKQTATFAEPGVWRRLRDREWPALPGGVPPQVTVPCGHYGPIGPSGTGDDAAALKRMIQTLTNRGVWRSCEAPLAARPPSDTLLQWRAELSARSDRQAAQDAIDATRKALDEEPINWRTVRDFKTLSTGEGLRFHSSFSFAKKRVVAAWIPGDRITGVQKLDVELRGYAGIESWRLRATLSGRRLVDVSLNEKPTSHLWDAGSHVHFPMCRGERQGGHGIYTRYNWIADPAWWDEERRDELIPDDYDEDEDDRIWDGGELWEALTGGDNAANVAPMGKLGPLRGVPLELDLVRVSDGAVVRLGSGSADGFRDDEHIVRIVWEKLETADSFLRVYAEWKLDFERPEDCGLHVRFYDRKQYDASNERAWVSAIARIWAMYDIAASAGITVRAAPPTMEEIDWREAVYAFQLVARRLDGISSDPARVISNFAYGVAPPREPSPRTTAYRALEYACDGSDAATCTTARPMTWRWPDREIDDASRYLFVAQVRGYWPAFARLYGVREDSSQNSSWSWANGFTNTKHHLEFRLRPRNLERERAYDFSDLPLARFLTIHVVDADGRVAEMPMGLYNLDGGQRPLWKGERDFGHAFPDDMPWIHPMCWADIDFHPWNDEVRSRSPADYSECDLLRVNFHTPATESERQYHVRVRRILAFVDELFWLDCPAARAPESDPESSSSSGDSV